MEEPSRIIQPGMRKVVITIPAPTFPQTAVPASISFDGFTHPVPAVNMLEVAQLMLFAANGLLQQLAADTARAAAPLELTVPTLQ